MLERDFERFSAVMLGVAENYGQSLSSEGISVRFKALASYAIGEIERAALSIIVCRKYTSMPTIADFLEHMGDGSAEDKAEVEAGKVLTAIGKHGAYASVVFDDPVTQAVIVLAYGGGVKLCFEITNCSSGHFEHVPPPKLIGDPAKVRAVLEAGKGILALSEDSENMCGEIHAVSGFLEAMTKEKAMSIMPNGTKHFYEPKEPL